ncbi:MAG: glycosyltransferase family 9 protein [Phycisphaerae bacterium]|nr:glycosyltransferase family 9 protein [Phycisphaerae bacterium]
MTIPPDNPQRILLIKPSALGDVVTAAPVLRGLRRRFPNSHIAWLVATSCVDLIRHDGDLNEVILFDRKAAGRLGVAGFRTLSRLRGQLKGGRFDWVIDLQGLLRSGLMTRAAGSPLRAGFVDAREGASFFYTHKFAPASAHTVDRNIELARSLGVDAGAADFTLQVAAPAREFAASLLARLGVTAKSFVVCVPPTRWATKVYPARHWRAVIGEIARRCPVLVVGGPGDVALCTQACENAQAGNDVSHVHNLAGQTSVSQMVAVIEASRGVVCSDSAAKFIAPAVGTPAVALLGPTRVEHTGVYTPGPHVRAVNITASLPCQGCLRRRCPHVACMQSIPPARVVETAVNTFDL